MGHPCPLAELLMSVGRSGSYGQSHRELAGIRFGVRVTLLGGRGLAWKQTLDRCKHSGWQAEWGLTGGWGGW